MRFLKRHSLLLIIIFAGMILRAWGMGFGLPHQFHQDEPIVVNHAVAYGTGDFNPHFFVIPPLTSYVLFFFYCVYFVLVNAFGILKDMDAFAISFFKDPTPFYLIGRAAAGFLPATLNIYLTYRLAGRFFSRKAALYSSLVMAVAFLNVINAHYIYADNLLVLFILLAYIAMAGLIKKPALIRYIVSGIFIGIAIAAKYNAAVLLLPLFLAHLTAAPKSGTRNIIFDARLLTSIGIIALSFVICNPYSVLDWKFFLLSVAVRIRHGYIGWSHHIAYSMFEGLGIAPTLLGIAGLGAVFKTGLKRGIFIISFPVLFYAHLIFVSQPFSRYVLALMPFLSMGLGFLLFDYIYESFKSRSKQFIVAALSLIIIAPTAAKSIKADMLFAGRDTRAEAAEWLEKNIPPYTKIAFDHTFFKPPVRQTAEQLKDKHDITGIEPELRHLKSKKLKFLIEALGGEKTYEIYYLIQGDEFAGQFLGFWPAIRNNMNELNMHGIEYVVFNSMKAPEGTQRLYKQISGRHKPVAVFSPYKNGEIREPYDEVATTCISVKSAELFSRQKSGPCLIIYRLR